MKNARLKPVIQGARVVALAVCAFLIWGQPAFAGWPERPITIVIPYAEGGPTDKVARPLVAQLSQALGQPVELAYRAGQGGTTGMQAVLETRGDDGYVFLLHNIGAASAPSLYKSLRFSPTRDFIPIGRIADAPMLLLGREDLPVLSARELWPFIKQNQNRLTVAYGGPGGAGHLCTLMLEKALNVKLFRVPYKGTGPALKNLEQGRADLLCDQTTHTLDSIDEGATKAYALATMHRLEMRPNIPTTIETGMPSLQITVWHGLFAAKGTPEEAITRMSAALQAAVASPAFVAAMTRVGVVPPTRQEATQAAFRAFVADETARLKSLIDASGQFVD